MFSNCVHQYFGEETGLMQGEQKCLDVAFFVSVDDIFIHHTAKGSKAIRLYQIISFETKKIFDDFVATLEKLLADKN